jgi:hypothetical protein
MMRKITGILENKTGIVLMGILILSSLFGMMAFAQDGGAPIGTATSNDEAPTILVLLVILLSSAMALAMVSGPGEKKKK